MAKKVRADQRGQHNTAYLKNRQRILATQSTCALCGKPVDMTAETYSPLAPSIDHIIPIALGGHPSDISNLQLTHRICNMEKSSKLINPKKFSENNNENNTENQLPNHLNWKTYRVS